VNRFGRGKKMGLALKPETDLPKWAEDSLDRLNSILILTVNPGFSGQKMDTSPVPEDREDQQAGR
jgi:pentose-5-phosphate-3-epimerase